MISFPNFVTYYLSSDPFIFIWVMAVLLNGVAALECALFISAPPLSNNSTPDRSDLCCLTTTTIK